MWIFSRQKAKRCSVCSRVSTGYREGSVVTSHECRGVSNYLQPDRLFNRLFRIRKYQHFPLLAPREGSLLAKRSILTHWGRVTHICVSKLTIIGSDNGLSPERRQAIIWTNAGILLIGTLGTNFSEILIEIIIFSVNKMHLKMSSGNWRPFCLGLNELIWNSSLYQEFRELRRRCPCFLQNFRNIRRQSFFYPSI